jgi:hypothetical protein
MIFFLNPFLGDDIITETVEQPEEVQSNIEEQQTSPASSEQPPTRQVSGKALATPAVRKMAMENNVSQLTLVLLWKKRPLMRSMALYEDRTFPL